MINRRRFLGVSLAGVLGAFVQPRVVSSETFLTVDQAQDLLFGDQKMELVSVELTPEQMKSIAKASKVRVRRSKLKTWKAADGGWFIVDQVIGKHENIDLAVGLTANGKVKGLEVLTYRETYGFEIRNERWRAQFTGRDHTERLKLDRQIKNITGATLSCRHVTDGINRLTHTWNQVLRHL